MKKRILIPYASYGNGHKAIALYIQNYFQEQNPKFEVMTLDLLEFAIPILGKFTQKLSENLMGKHPFIWDFIYNIFDNKYSITIPNTISMAMFKNKKLRKIIKDFNPHLTISTHFSSSSLLAYYNRKKIINSRLITVVTDYEAHEMWLKNFKVEDAIVLSDKEEVKYLVKRGINPRKIKDFGIPVAPIIPTDFNKEKALKKYNFSGNRLICLFFAGGGRYTNKAILNYAKKLIKADLNIDFLFVSGRDKTAKDTIEKYIEKHNAKNFRVFGFVTNVPELFQTCDFVVTKPGGVQTTEALYFKKPLILVTGSGGQEKANANYFVKNGYGKRFKTAFGFNHFMTQISKKPFLLEGMERKLKESSGNTAMKKLYSLSIGILKKD